MFFGFFRKFWNSPHSPWPAVAPNDGGCWSDMSNTTLFACPIGASVARVIGSGYTLAGTFLFPVPKPPCFAQTSAACGDARYFTNASIAGLSRKVTNRSPPISTALAFGPGLIDGHVKVLKPVVGFAFVEEVMTPPTKSASNTIAAFGGDANAFVTESLKPYCSAPLVPPAMFDVSPMIFAIDLRAVATDESVHLILCAESASYFAAPNVRR